MIQGAAAVTSLDSASSIMRLQDFAAQAHAKPAINQTDVSTSGGNQIADGFRAHLESLLSSENRVRAKGLDGGAEASAVKTIGPGMEPAGTKMIGDTKPVSDQSLNGLTRAFEYSTNMALVSMVVTGMTNGITTLTSKGG